MPMGGVGMALLGGSAATSAMQAAVDRGASDDQALWIGAVAGTMEAVMEKLSIDSLFGLKSPKAVLNVMKQAGIEGTEEGLTTIANTLADALIMGNRSELQTHKRNLMALGYSEKDAQKIAATEWVKNLALDVAGGMLSGGVFGSAKAGADTYGNRNAVDVHPEMAYDSIREELDFDRQFMDGFNAEEELHDGKERLYLRNGSQRDGGTNSGGQVSAVETGSGRDQSRQAETAAVDGGTTALSYGQKVSAASLGIPGGSTEANIQIVTGGETLATRAAMKTAKDNGLQLALFTGGNLQITNESGKTDSVRGYISGDKVFVRADHPAYTADQIMRHEAGHARIARGEIDVRQIRERIRQRYGIKRTNKLSELYTAAYEGSGLNADEIWEEVVCDSLGDMNIFRELPKGNVVDGMLQAVKESAEAETRMTRGPPNDGADLPGKMSRENGYKKVGKQAWRQIQRERMSRYGGNFDTMPKMDTFYAHDMLFVLENYDETSFGVIEAVDPAKHQEKASLVLEVMKDGNIEYPSEYRRRIENLRRWKRQHASDSVLTGNTRTGAEDAGTSSQYGNTRDRGAVAEKSSGVVDSELRLGREREIKRNLQSEGVEYTKSIELLQQMEVLQALYRRELEAEKLERAFLRGFDMEE